MNGREWGNLLPGIQDDSIMPGEYPIMISEEYFSSVDRGRLIR